MGTMDKTAELKIEIASSEKRLCQQNKTPNFLEILSQESVESKMDVASQESRLSQMEISSQESLSSKMDCTNLSQNSIPEVAMLNAESSDSGSLSQQIVKEKGDARKRKATESPLTTEQQLHLRERETAIALQQVALAEREAAILAREQAVASKEAIISLQENILGLKEDTKSPKRVKLL